MLHTHWNPWQLGRRWGWDPGVAQRLYAPPGKPSENLMCSSHILHVFIWNLVTHIDLIELNNFCVTCHGASAQQEVGYSGLFKKHMLWNLKYSSQDFQHTKSTKPGERDLKTLGMLNCGGIFDISKWFARGEVMKLWRELRYRKCLIKSTYIVWFWSQFSGLFGVWSRSHRCDNYEAKL